MAMAVLAVAGTGKVTLISLSRKQFLFSKGQMSELAWFTVSSKHKNKDNTSFCTDENNQEQGVIRYLNSRYYKIISALKVFSNITRTNVKRNIEALFDLSSLKDWAWQVIPAWRTASSTGYLLSVQTPHYSDTCQHYYSIMNADRTIWLTVRKHRKSTCEAWSKGEEVGTSQTYRVYLAAK